MHKRPRIETICLNCTKSFTTGYFRQKYCSRPCGREAQRKSYFLIRKRKDYLPKGTVGAISELRVASFLLEAGYEVFRSLSPSCSCDLAILKNGYLLRIEVRTGYRTSSGIVATMRRHKADILAICLESEIVFEPPI